MTSAPPPTWPQTTQQTNTISPFTPTSLQDQADYIDLNLGCPQRIAKRGFYGAFLMDHQQLVGQLVSAAAQQLRTPVSVKIRLFPQLQDTISYARMLQQAGASLLAIHGRTRDMKVGVAVGVQLWLCSCGCVAVGVAVAVAVGVAVGVGRMVRCGHVNILLCMHVQVEGAALALMRPPRSQRPPLTAVLSLLSLRLLSLPLLPQDHAAHRADWEAISAVRAALRIPVLANGDVRCLAEARALMDATGV